MKKSRFVPKFQFFSHKIDIFAPTLILTETLVILPQKFTPHYFITGLRNSLICPKTDDFCIKMLFFTKRKQRHQKLTLFKNKRYFFKKT